MSFHRFVHLQQRLILSLVKAEPVAEDVKAEEEAAAADEAVEEIDEYSITNYTLIEDESLVHPKVKIAQDYILSVLRAMDVNAVQF